MKRGIIGLMIVPIFLSLLASCNVKKEEISVELKNTNITENHNVINNLESNDEFKKEVEMSSIKPVLLDVKIYHDKEKMSSIQKFFIRSSASSVLNREGDISYYDVNAHDFDLSTVWVEGDVDNGIGENLEYTIEQIENYTITHIDIINGYIKNDDLWKENSRVKKLKVWLDGEVYAILALEDSKEVQRFEIKGIELKKEEHLKFEILDVYQGSKYKDVAITEIQFCGKTQNVDKSSIFQQGGYEVTMILEDGATGIFPHVVQDHMILNIKFTKPANKKSAEEAFEKNVSNQEEIVIKYKWIDNQNLNIYLSKLKTENYHALLRSAKDNEGFDFMELKPWADGLNDFDISNQNNIITMNLETKEFSDNINVSFPNLLYYPKSISPYDDNYVYYNYYNNNPMCENMFIPMIYDENNGWISINNNKKYDVYEGDELTWINEDLVYIQNDIFNINGELIRTLDLEGNIVGIQPCLDGSKIGVFASEIDEPLKLYIFDNNCNELIQTMEMPFTYTCNHECNRIFLTNLKFKWIDNDRLLVEGWDNKKISRHFYKGKPSLYKVNTIDKSVTSIKENVWLLKYLGNNKAIVYEYADIEQDETITRNYEILDIEDKTSNKISFLDNEWDCYIYFNNNNNMHSYKNDIIYEKNNCIYFYNIITKSEKFVKLDSKVSILGIKNGKLYLNVNE